MLKKAWKKNPPYNGKKNAARMRTVTDVKDRDGSEDHIQNNYFLPRYSKSKEIKFC